MSSLVPQLERKGWKSPGFSPLEVETLLLLKNGPKSLKGLKESIDARDTSILHTLKRLESDNLVKKDSITHTYSLTNSGLMYAAVLDRLVNLSETLEKSGDFWLLHDISGIPESLITEIGVFKDATLVTATPSDLDAVYARFLALLKRSRRVDGVSSIFHPDYVEAVTEILSKGAKVRLILTQEVLDRVREAVKIGNLTRLVRRIFIDRNLEVYIGADIKVGLTVTESFLSLGLFTHEGVYDPNVDLMSESPKALEWGRRLFEHYRSLSRKVRFSSML